MQPPSSHNLHRKCSNHDHSLLHSHVHQPRHNQPLDHWRPRINLRVNSVLSRLLLCTFLLAAFVPTLVQAQSVAQEQSDETQPPPNFRSSPTALPDREEVVDLETVEPGEPSITTAAAQPMIVDTDLGVDDAAALIWLLSQRRHPVDLLGIVTVAGNTTVEQATRNVITVTTWLEAVDLPIVQGAASPLSQTRSHTGKLIHGPDGLWGLNSVNPPSLDGIPTDPVAYYCETLTQNPNTLILALGPLTNLANAIGGCPAAWEGIRIVSLGGAKFGGNQTPVTEYNYWQDPEAASILVSQSPTYSYTVEIVLLDAFNQFILPRNDIDDLAEKGVAAMRNLYPALDIYLQGLEANQQPLTLPDPVAAIYALETVLGDAQSSLTRVVSGPGVPEYVRGQTVVAIDFAERIPLIADDAELSSLADLFFSTFPPPIDLNVEIGKILFREPDNAIVVTDILAMRMYKIFLRGVTAASGSSEPGDPALPGHQTFFPLVEGPGQ